jgi:2-C-methyl-D-erythritol 4-phosphate cytidylyltransferase
MPPGDPGGIVQFRQRRPAAPGGWCVPSAEEYRGRTMFTDDDDPSEIPPALGSVVVDERGSLPFMLIHGEALVACAAWALGDSGVTPVDHGTEWEGLAAAGEPFVLHDALCPMTPASFIADCVRLADATGEVIAGADATGRVLSPLALPPAVLAALDASVLDAALATPDFDALVALLEQHGAVRRHAAPPSAARVRSEQDVRALERLTGASPA